ncbi:MAG: EAL domain-containing protein [Actinobacteria bacterium]|nr:EAL domain-containing protein [Actinomycetota bacterium]
MKGGRGEEILHAIHHVGRGQNRFVPDLVRELTRKLADEERASERRKRQAERIRSLIRGEGLGMAFQPIVDLRDGRIVAMEALARIAARPRRSPDWWVAEARALGLDVDLELAALHAALAHLERVPPGMYLSVNASPPTLTSPRVLEALGSVQAERVILEVTEQAPVEDQLVLEEAISKLRARGVRLAIDDAGAGFASLGNILRLAPDFIKLDISLIRGIESDEAHRATASALIRFASDIGAEIIAEGIETPAQLHALRALGVPYGQGFHLARPAPLPPADRVPTRIELASGSAGSRGSVSA